MQTFEPEPEEITQNKRYPDPCILRPRQIAMIDEALRSLGAFGEVRLVIEQGRLRFIITHKSFDALRWYPGRILNED